MQYYKVVYAYNQDGTETEAERKVVGGLSLAYTLALVRDVCYAFHRAECQIRAVYIGEDDDWTEVPDWADQERAQLAVIAKQAEKEEKMSDLDKKQLDRLYNLLHEKEQSDPDVAASLRWAIFQLEQKDNEKQTGDLVFRLAFTPEAEINEIMDTGMFNEIIKGYLVIAMRNAGEDKDAIDKAVCALDNAFDFTDAAAARKAYRNKDATGQTAQYEAELHELKTVKLPEALQKVMEARKKGDLAENIDYDIAKDEQCDIEARIRRLEKIIEDARNSGV